MEQNLKKKKNNKNNKKLEKKKKPLEKIFRDKGNLEVFENEEASLQDQSYTFDDENTGNDDIHFVSDFD